MLIDVSMFKKLTRNLFIIAVIPFVSYLFFKQNDKGEETAHNRRIPKWYQLIPLFVIGFLLLAFVRTLGDMTLAQFGNAFGLFNEDVDRKSTRLNSSHVAI